MFCRLGLAVSVLLLGASASAQNWKTGNFNASFDQQGLFAGGSGDGYNDGRGPWYYYPNDPQGAWWNQWWYDDPFSTQRWKEFIVDLEITIPDPGQQSSVDVVVNWTTPRWSDDYGGSGFPALPEYVPDFPVEATYIMRLNYDPFNQYIHEGEVIEPILIHWEWTFWEYNPEWVSIDLRGSNVEIVRGVIQHRCIPAPASLAILGVAGLFARRRR